MKVTFIMARNCVKDHCKNDDHFRKRFDHFIKRFGEHAEYESEKVLRWLGYDLNKKRLQP